MAMRHRERFLMGVDDYADFAKRSDTESMQ
jgi:hypothetical protein